MSRILLVSLLTIAALDAPSRSPLHTSAPANGFVPDSITAVTIAVAVWTPIYGERLITSEKPYHARLRNDTWIVTGNLSAGSLGGSAIAEIASSDARIIRVVHTQ